MEFNEVMFSSSGTELLETRNLKKTTTFQLSAIEILSLTLKSKTERICVSLKKKCKSIGKKSEHEAVTNQDCSSWLSASICISKGFSGRGCEDGARPRVRIPLGVV